ncbi:SIR2 family protein [Mucilaginibacter paludis]|uniref:Uncharacterized protein n=1 Tax=Mucilaginibacter paludis DSM 18603 TaxID=714943 RepID=H1YIC7_9SPHI|nr:SIR2 family protein [Mucilaginibacter paludis]EHQ27540.1 hypothetical protein Mucpa_3441 [Mucilaginibacter paludis DSM 18603]
MIENLTTLSYSLYHNKGVYALFLGSGISRNAGIPTGWEIVVDQISQLAALNKESISGTAEDWYREKYKKEPDYSEILEAITHTQEERVNALRPYFEPNNEEFEEKLKQPTIAHRQIAQLVKKGIIKVIVTTNFDRLIENALKDEGIEPVVISNPNHIDNVQPLIHNPITVIKINGDYLDTKFLNIKSELSSYDAQMENLVRYVFENFGLITSGWSAAWDVAIVDLLKSSNKFRYGNYFTFKGKATKELESLSAFRKGVLLQITDADKFFQELNENIEALESLQLQHPLTADLALAKLKKFVAKDEFRISLHDLILTEANDSSMYLNQLQYPQPTLDALKIELEVGITKMNTLSILLVNGIYWGKSQHRFIWTKAFSKFLYPPDNARSYSMWSNFQKFPLLYLTYVIGLSALVAGDFSLLHDILFMKKWSKYSEKDEPLLEDIYAEKVIEKDWFNQMNKTNHHTPFSEFLFNKLKPIFEPLIPNESDYINYFDYFEYTFSLAFISQSGDNWTPLGRFAWRMKSMYKRETIVHRKIKEAEEKKDEFELSNNTLFKNYGEYLLINTKLMNYLDGIHFR